MIRDWCAGSARSPHPSPAYRLRRPWLLQPLHKLKQPRANEAPNLPTSPARIASWEHAHARTRPGVGPTGGRGEREPSAVRHAWTAERSRAKAGCRGPSRRDARTRISFARTGPRRRKSLPHISVRQAPSLMKIRRRPTLPGSCPPSTIGATRLDFSVRNGKRYDPCATTTGNYQGYPADAGRPRPEPRGRTLKTA
ncbi:MAG: hypothetical protein JWL76_1351 [Thermoleophilia bacterium]|nr:hypothetical protein [Thermoleophilia bacterium]